jgi:glycerol-3-phosphate dehydrogenase
MKLNLTVVKRSIVSSMALAVLAFSATSHAGAWDDKVNRLLDTEVKQWLSDPVVISNVKRQNIAHANLTQSDIDRLDKQWRSEAKQANRPMIDAVLGNAVSSYLRNVASQADGLYAEIFIMDNKGLNVGQSAITSDYWQGDEAKWQKTYLVGPKSVFIDEIQYDDSATRFQIQVSVPVVDPETQSVIGAVTIGLAMRKLALLE